VDLLARRFGDGRGWRCSDMMPGRTVRFPMPLLLKLARERSVFDGQFTTPHTPLTYPQVLYRPAAPVRSSPSASRPNRRNRPPPSRCFQAHPRRRSPQRRRWTTFCLFDQTKLFNNYPALYSPPRQGLSPSTARRAIHHLPHPLQSRCRSRCPLTSRRPF